MSLFQYGGNPVSLAIANAVLDVIENEKLCEKAVSIGNFMIKSLKSIQDDYNCIGEIRGSGLFFGVDLVKSKETREPATELAEYIVQRFREEKVLMSTEGKYGNVLKFKSPMVFSMENARFWLKTFHSILNELELYRCNSVSSTSSSSSSLSLDSLSDSLTSDDEFVSN